MVHEGFLQDYPDRRPFNLMRAGYSGSQRFGMIPWTGDVNRSWGGLQPQPEISLQMGLQGLAYMHSDLGGFAWDNRDEELYVRWMQYGVFQPVYRPHAQDDLASEPVFWDDNTIALSKKAIELRYKLMPYIYTAAFQNAQKGLPFMRPLFFEEPDNHKLYKVSENYLFGDDFLVAPVLRKGERHVTVHAPNTANWFDFYSGKKYAGGHTYQVSTSADHIPVFVRGGAIIPIADLVQSTDDYSLNHLTLQYFLDWDALENHRTIYHDDGLTREAYQRGEYEILHITTGHNQRRVLLTFEKETGLNASLDTGFSDITLQVMNVEIPPIAITLAGQALEFEYDHSSNRLTIDTFELNNEVTELSISF